MKYKIAIDASRSRSGGGKAHLVGILSELDPSVHGIEEIHIWAYKSILDSLPNLPWIKKHCPKETEMSILKQLYWQYSKLHIEISNQECDILLNTDAGSVCQFHPAITMSRDMLSFERREIARFGFGKDWLRLYILRFTQMKSLKYAAAALFLTKYAADKIQTWTGEINRYKIIPHGIGHNFKDNRLKNKFPENGERPIRCLYVSNVARYKHQWNVALAIEKLRNKKYNINLNLVGGGDGPAQRKLELVLEEIDPQQDYIRQDSFLTHEQIPLIIAESDIFIFASSCENMPNTLIEAMACGMPIACSNLGPMPEILEDGGTYFNPEDVDSIAKAIKSLILNKEKRDYFSLRSKELSQQYSWKRCAKETMDYLIEVLINDK
ncbi:MAG: glycosyltransferase family 1 protein [Saprospiraceae bacterium]|jgi:glycosyltransferase involved in cell wall biosynthesis|nr:glycosyltransferase family 1 protein [Saprospiraceae bacterium]